MPQGTAHNGLDDLIRTLIILFPDAVVLSISRVFGLEFVVNEDTEGEPTCIVHSGITYPFGSDILEKRQFLEQQYDWLRMALTREPRGHNDMFGVFVTPPSGPDADAGMIWMDGDRFVDMCGHGTIALGMAMVATGLHRSTHRPDTIRFETTAGPVVATVESEGDRVLSTCFENVPAFVAAQNIPVELPEIGKLVADVSFGGNFFAQIDLSRTPIKIRPENGSRLRELGLLAREQVNKQVDIRHPIHSHIERVPFVTFYHEPERADSLYRCVHVFSDGKLDRSPGARGRPPWSRCSRAKERSGSASPSAPKACSAADSSKAAPCAKPKLATTVPSTSRSRGRPKSQATRSG